MWKGWGGGAAGTIVFVLVLSIFDIPRSWHLISASLPSYLPLPISTLSFGSEASFNLEIRETDAFNQNEAGHSDISIYCVMTTGFRKDRYSFLTYLLYVCNDS